MGEQLDDSLARELVRKADGLLEHMRERGQEVRVEDLRLARDECSTKILKLRSVADAERSVTGELVEAVRRLGLEIQRSQRSLEQKPWA